MEFHCEYSTYNNHHKVLVDLQASNMDAFRNHKNSPGHEIANANFYAVRPKATRIRSNNEK